jgi:crotonobetainyl-CoA:carnitine CoA-transferase CaiB-like acyl-CoA transferase
MASDNIFSGLKVVDLASFIAGPSAAVILSDFGADVIKVEPPSGDLWRHGHQIPPQPQAKDAYPWHLANRNKRGITLDLKSPSASQVLEKLVKWADVLIVNTPHPGRKKLKLEYDDVVQWNPRLIYADVTGFGENGPDANLPGFDITSYWARSGLLSMTRDAGAPPTWPGVATMRPPSASIPRSSRRSIVASAPARDRMSRPRCSPRASGPRAFRSRRRCARPSSSPRTIA